MAVLCAQRGLEAIGGYWRLSRGPELAWLPRWVGRIGFWGRSLGANVRYVSSAMLQGGEPLAARVGLCQNPTMPARRTFHRSQWGPGKQMPGVLAAADGAGQDPTIENHKPDERPPTAEELDWARRFRYRVALAMQRGTVKQLKSPSPATPPATKPGTSAGRPK